ncbi:MAG: hypothetical protein H7A36_01655 [Chlamydiales bacterium]|nr:hypothetical protein [Chlamydiales bacterium]
MHASKFIKIPALLDGDELAALFKHLGPFSIFEMGRISEKVELSLDEFLEAYISYIGGLKKGEKSDWPFAYIFTVSHKALEIREIEGRFLVRPKMPVVQLQPSRVRYSKADGAFQTGVYGKQSISWGIQFSYPFLFQDATTHEIEKITPCERFPNTQLFLDLQKWLRKNSSVTPFEVEGKRINVPIRLGKKCFDWISHHPDLEEISVVC